MTKKEKTACVIAFTAGAAALFFSGGHYGTAFTAFIWPAALLFCVRHIKKRFFPAVLFIVMAAVNSVKLLGLSDDSVAVDICEAIIITAVQFLPLLAEFFISRRDGEEKFRCSPVRALVFPAFYSGLSVLFCLTPISATASVAYTLGGLTPADRAVSVVGIFGLLFLLMWFASLLERFVSFLLSRGRYRLVRDCAVFVPVLVCVIAAGFISEARQPASYFSTVRVATSVGLEQPLDENGEYITLPAFDSLVSLKKTLAQAKTLGAEILVYTEENFSVYDYEAEKLVSFVCGKAKEYGMYVYLPLDITASEEGALSENCIKLINPDGEVEQEYVKSRLVPFIEGDYKKGDGVIPVNELKLKNGKTVKAASFICYDGDSPLYINSIPADTDILISPSWDWEGILYYHTPAMRFRALENGASLVKSTYDGISEIFDCYGKSLCRFNSFETGFNHTEAADVPLRGVKTPYACVFSHLDYVYIVLPALFCVILFLKKKKTAE